MIELVQRTYFSPADDLPTALLAFINGATQQIRISDYSYNLEPLTEALIAKHRAGVDVALVLDHSQAHVSTERPVVAELRAAGVPLVEGSSERRRIMHLKTAIVDGEWVLSGSYNFTSVAELESNFFDIQRSRDRAKAFLSNWQSLWDWISTNEPSWQKE